MPSRAADGVLEEQLTARRGPLWLPGQAARLASNKWRACRFGLRPREYGSTRWLLGDRAAPRRALASAIVGGAKAVIEGPDPVIDARCGALDLKLERELPAGGPALLREAFALLAAVSGLDASLGALVRSIHLLRGRGAGYDTSHSDPELPFSVFVSLPLGERGASLRLAESILHEAMHLQLTLVEEVVPLVSEGAATGYSPWQRRTRPVGGLLHGLYVFAVVDEYLAELLDRGILLGADQVFAAKRRMSIADEVADVASLGQSSALTPVGREFTQYLLASSLGRQGSRGSSN